MFASGPCEICMLKVNPVSSDGDGNVNIQFSSLESETQSKNTFSMVHAKEDKNSTLELPQYRERSNSDSKSKNVQWQEDSLTRHIVSGRRYSEPNLLLTPSKPILKHKANCIVLIHNKVEEEDDEPSS